VTFLAGSTGCRRCQAFGGVLASDFAESKSKILLSEQGFVGQVRRPDATP
jgi:hypothetical protein